MKCVNENNEEKSRKLEEKEMKILSNEEMKEKRKCNENKADMKRKEAVIDE